MHRALQLRGTIGHVTWRRLANAETATDPGTDSAINTATARWLQANNILEPAFADLYQRDNIVALIEIFTRNLSITSHNRPYNPRPSKRQGISNAHT